MKYLIEKLPEINNSRLQIIADALVGLQSSVRDNPNEVIVTYENDMLVTNVRGQLSKERK